VSGKKLIADSSKARGKAVMRPEISGAFEPPSFPASQRETFKLKSFAL
jgi:hypothetical protein